MIGPSSPFGHEDRYADRADPLQAGRGGGQEGWWPPSGEDSAATVLDDVATSWSNRVARIRGAGGDGRRSDGCGDVRADELKQGAVDLLGVRPADVVGPTLDRDELAVGK
jgi:hypothetical protein